MEITFGNTSFQLDHRRAIVHPTRKTLIIADLHVGKSAHFRKSGLSMPSYSFEQDLLRLKLLLDDYLPERLLILGDLYHSHFNEEFERWHDLICQYTSCEAHLITGNHDKTANRKNPFLKSLAVHNELIEDGILYTHEPTEKEALFNICGHIHPGVMLKGLGRQKLKTYCFWKSQYQMILPAFSELTGLGIIKPKEGDSIYTIAGEQVVLVG